MQDFTKKQLEISRDKMLAWQQRYTDKEYPEKLALNTVYEVLLLMATWDWINEECFSGAKQFETIEDALDHIVNVQVVGYINDVRPIVNTYYHMDTKLLTLDLESIRKYVTHASEGDSHALEVVKSTYSVHFASIYLLYLWAAIGLTGISMEGAYRMISGVYKGDEDSLNGLYGSFNINVQFCFDDPLQVEACALLIDYGNE